MAADIIHIHELEDELAFSSHGEVYFTREGEVVAASPLALKLLGYQSYELRQLFIAQLMPQALRLLDVCHYQSLADKPIVFARKQGGRFAAQVEHKERLVAFPGEVLSLQAMLIRPLQPGAQLHQQVRSHLSTALPKSCLLDLNTLKQDAQLLNQSLKQGAPFVALAQDFLQAQALWQEDIAAMLEQAPQSQTSQRVFNLPLALALWQQEHSIELALLTGDYCAEIVLGEQDKLFLLLNTLLDFSQCQSGVSLEISPCDNSHYSRLTLRFEHLDAQAKNQLASAIQVWQQGDFYAQLNCLNTQLVLDQALSFSFDYLLMPVIQGRAMDCIKAKRILLVGEQAQGFGEQLINWGAKCDVQAQDAAYDLVISSAVSSETASNATLQLELEANTHVVSLANTLCALYQQAPLWHYSQEAMARRQQRLCLGQQNVVLLVSDNVDFCQSMQSLIEQDNCYLVCAANALDAILAAQEMAYHAIVLDCQLSSMPAFETLVHMRSNALLNRHCKVFALSAQDSTNLRLAAAEVGIKHLYLHQHLNLLGTDLHRYLLDNERAQLDFDFVDVQEQALQQTATTAALEQERVSHYLMAWGAEQVSALNLAAFKQLRLGIQLWCLARQQLAQSNDALQEQRMHELEVYLLSIARCLGLSCVADALTQSYGSEQSFAQQQLQQVLLQQSLEQARRALWFEFGLSC